MPVLALLNRGSVYYAPLFTKAFLCDGIGIRNSSSFTHYTKPGIKDNEDRWFCISLCLSSLRCHKGFKAAFKWCASL